MSLRHPPVVIRQAQLERRDPQPLQPLAKPVLPMPLGIPVGQHQHRGFLAFPRPQLRMNRVVFRPRRSDRTGERQHIRRIQRIVARGCRRVPFAAMLRSLPRVSPQKCRCVRILGIAANMLQPPLKGLHPPVVIRRPPPVLVPPYPPLKPVHLHSLPQRSNATRNPSHRFNFELCTLEPFRLQLSVSNQARPPPPALSLPTACGTVDSWSSSPPSSSCSASWSAAS